MSSNLHFLHPQNAQALDALRQGQISREPRAKALLLASLSKADNTQCTPCFVTNISPGGARIKIDGAVNLPSNIKVSIPQRNMARMARQIWRRGDQLGLAFLPEDDPKPEEIEATKDTRICALEAEVATLKAEVGVLKYQLYQREE
jgi:PilZ domain